MPVIPCPSPTPITLGVVTFDPSAFVVAYPEYAGFLVTGSPPTSPLLSNAFALAQTILNNTCSSRVQDANLRDTLLQLLTAHIAFLVYGTNDGATPPNITPPPGIVGRINQAAEGSVSVAAEFGGDGGPTQDWYTSTKYGAMYWTATSIFRTFLPIPAPGCGPNGPGFGFPYPGYGGPGCGC